MGGGEPRTGTRRRSSRRGRCSRPGRAAPRSPRRLRGQAQRNGGGVGAAWLHGHAWSTAAQWVTLVRRGSTATATASRVWDLRRWASPPECGGQPRAAPSLPVQPEEPVVATAMAPPRRPLRPCGPGSGGQPHAFRLSLWRPAVWERGPFRPCCAAPSRRCRAPWRRACVEEEAHHCEKGVHHCEEEGDSTVRRRYTAVRKGGGTTVRTSSMGHVPG